VLSAAAAPAATSDFLADITERGSAGWGIVSRFEQSPYRGGGMRIDLLPLYLYEGEHVSIASLPGMAERINATFRIATLTPRVADRVSLLQTVLALIVEAGASIPVGESSRLRHMAEDLIRGEAAIDEKYAAMSRRLLASATSAAGQARISDVERILDRVAKEDGRLGGRRPEVMQALSASLQMQLDNTRTNVVSQQDTLTLTQVRFNAGAVSELDVSLYNPGFLMFEELSKDFENYSGALDYMRKCYFAPAPNEDPFAGFLRQIQGWVRYGLSDN